MGKKVILVGHCGPDSSYLTLAVRSAAPDAIVESADDPPDLRAALSQGADLILFNRELGYGFDAELGVELITRLKAEHPNVKMMLVSNYPEAQADAIAAGALPGFGKREIGSKRVLQLLRDALDA